MNLNVIIGRHDVMLLLTQLDNERFEQENLANSTPSSKPTKPNCAQLKQERWKQAKTSHKSRRIIMLEGRLAHEII